MPTLEGVTFEPAPLAAPRTRTLGSAEPAKKIGWLLLGAVGTWSFVLLLQSLDPWAAIAPALCFTLMFGFMQSHRHPGRVLSRLWIGFFTGFMVVGAVVAKVGALFVH